MQLRVVWQVPDRLQQPAKPRSAVHPACVVVDAGRAPAANATAGAPLLAALQVRHRRRRRTSKCCASWRGKEVRAAERTSSFETSGKFTMFRLYGSAFCHRTSCQHRIPGTVGRYWASRSRYRRGWALGSSRKLVAGCSRRILARAHPAGEAVSALAFDRTSTIVWALEGHRRRAL